MQAGSTVGSVAIFTDHGDIYAELSSQTSGTFQYALYLTSSRIRTLDLPLTDYTSGSLRKFYPYNWTESQATTPISPDLLVPGVMAYNPVGQWVVIAHHNTQLYTVDLRLSGSDKVARFFRQFESSWGVDRSTYNLVMGSGDVDFLHLTTAASLRQVQRARLGSPLSMAGLITQAPHKGWGREQGYASRDDYALMAQRVAAGGIKHIQLRINEPQRWVSDIFTAEGLLTHYYMFLGVARWRNGVDCYSIRFASGSACIDGSSGGRDWVLRDSNGDTYKPSNSAWAFVDLRVREYRQALVDRAVRAVQNGFRGIFFDGPQLWRGDDGWVGGANARGIPISWYNARAKLVRETKRAIREVTPNALIGMLGNTYVDFQAAADYLVVEITHWVNYPDDPRCRTLRYASMETKLTSADFSNLYQFFAPLRVLAIKGNDAQEVNRLHALAVDAGVGSHRYGDSARQIAYIGIGDFMSNYTAGWASVIEGVAGSMQSPVRLWPSDADCP